jgi:hypothetical protein
MQNSNSISYEGNKHVYVTVTLRSCIREVLGSNRGQDIGYRDCSFQPLHVNAEITSQIRQKQLPSKPFSIHCSSIDLPFDDITQFRLTSQYG